MLIHNPQELALKVASQRKKLALSQEEVANRVGLKQKTISAFENNPTNVKLSTLFLILSAVNLDINLLPKMTSNETSSSKLEW
jgi:HTH-type transcriptional regulator/antitoxin HipB